MMYDEDMIAPMREELTALGIQETRTPDAVEKALSEKGTTLVVVNSVCGCAAAQALLKDGDVVFMLERWQISGRDAQAIGQDIAQAINEYC